MARPASTTARASPAARLAAAIVAVFLIAYPLRAVLASADVSPWVRLALFAALCAGTWRPGVRLPLLIGLVPLVPLLPALTRSVPHGIVHAVVATQAVAWLGDVARGRPVWRPGDAAGWLWMTFAAVAAASIAMHLVAGYRLVFVDQRAYVAELHSLVSRYVFWPPSSAPENLLRAWTTIVDGTLVFLMVRADARGPRLARALVAVCAAASLFGLLQAWTGIGLQRSWTTFDGVTRIHGTFTDPNAFGAWLALMLPAAAALLVTSAGRRRILWGVAAAAMALALVFTGSRSGWGAALIGLAVLTWRLVRTTGWLNVTVARRVRVAMAASLVLGALSVTTLVAVGTSRDVRQFDQRSYLDTLLYTFNLRQPADEILKGRVLLWRTSLAMIEEAPLFGIGVGRIHREFYSFSQYLNPNPPPGSSAHNTFLTIAAESGLLGLAAWIALLAAVLAIARRGPEFEAAGHGVLREALLAGLVAYVATMATGDRTLLREDAVLFAAMTALAVSMARPVTPRLRRACGLVASGLVLLLVVTVPARASLRAAAVELHRVRHGLSELHGTRDGMRYRWTEAHATFYVPADRPTLALPVRRAGPQAQEVVVRLNGLTADRFTLADDEWRTLRYVLPRRDGLAYHRVDVQVTPVVDVRGRTSPVGIRLGEPEY